MNRYDAVHVAGRRGATFDLYPSEDVAKALEHFWAKEKVVGAICHGAIAPGNNPDRIRGRKVTGYTLEGDQELQRIFGSAFLIPHYPQTALEEADGDYQRVAPDDPLVIVTPFTVREHDENGQKADLDHGRGLRIGRRGSDRSGALRP